MVIFKSNNTNRKCAKKKYIEKSKVIAAQGRGSSLCQKKQKNIKKAWVTECENSTCCLINSGMCMGELQTQQCSKIRYKMY